jgi:hypothetical protein
LPAALATALSFLSFNLQGGTNSLWKVVHAVLLLSPPAERVSESENDAFGNGDALDEQEGTIGAEDPQRAFDLAPPVKRQFAGDDFDELKICVRGRREEGRVPPPGRDYNGERADERSALECAAAGRSPNEYHVSLHDWVNSLTARCRINFSRDLESVLIHIPDLSGRVRSTLRKQVTNGLKPGYQTLPLFQSCRW